MNDGLDAREATAALRVGSIGRLREGFDRWLSVESRVSTGDERDAMISIAPFVDCARRLGADPTALLGPLVGAAPPWVREAFGGVVGRSADVTLSSLGWSVVETSDGPAYRFAWPAG